MKKLHRQLSRTRSSFSTSRAASFACGASRFARHVPETLSVDFDARREPPCAAGAWPRRFRRKFVLSGAARRDFGADVGRAAENAWTYALICTVGSVAGALLGYAIGALLFDTIGQRIIEFYHLGPRAAELRASSPALVLGGHSRERPDANPIQARHHYQRAVGLYFSALRPACARSREARVFSGEAWVLQHYGESDQCRLDNYFGWFLLILLIAVILGFLDRHHLL